MKANEIKQTISLLDKEIAKNEAYIQAIGNLFNDIQKDHFEQVKKTKATIVELQTAKGELLESLRNSIENYRPYTAIELVGRIGLNVKDRNGDSCEIISVTATKNKVEVELGYEMSIAIVSPEMLLENYIIGYNKDYVSRNDLHLGIKIS
jgi:hypothetical protein